MGSSRYDFNPFRLHAAVNEGLYPLIESASVGKGDSGRGVAP